MESLFRGHCHCGAVVFDSSHLSAFDSLGLVIGQAITLPDSPITCCDFEATFKLDHFAFNLSDVMARSLFKNAITLPDLFLKEEFFTGAALDTGAIKHGPDMS